MIFTDTIMEYLTVLQQLEKHLIVVATTLFDSTFYVLTTARNVYKCLDNNVYTSTDEPTQVSTSVTTTSDDTDGNICTLSAAQQSNFLSTDFMQ